MIKLIEKLDLQNETELCGTLTHEDVIKYYDQSDLFVLGCQIAENGDRDGIPNVMAESMAMDLPVVATDVSGLPEFLEDRISGMMVPPKDYKALAFAMETILKDDKLRKKVTLEARNRIIKSFNNKILVKDLAQVYCDMIPELAGCQQNSDNPENSHPI